MLRRSTSRIIQLLHLKALKHLSTLRGAELEVVNVESSLDIGIHSVGGARDECGVDGEPGGVHTADLDEGEEVECQLA